MGTYNIIMLDKLHYRLYNIHVLVLLGTGLSVYEVYYVNILGLPILDW